MAGYNVARGHGETPDAREPRGARRLYRYSTRYLQGLGPAAPRLDLASLGLYFATAEGGAVRRAIAAEGQAAGRAKRAQAASGAATRLHACTNLR